MNRRLTLGLAAIALLATGLPLSLMDSGSVLGAACIRVGLVTSAAWMAYDDLKKIAPWMLGAVLMGLAVVAWRPKLVVIVVPVLIAFWFLRPRASRSPGERPNRPPDQ